MHILRKKSQQNQILTQPEPKKSVSITVDKPVKERDFFRPSWNKAEVALYATKALRNLNKAITPDSEARLIRAHSAFVSF